MRTALAGRWHDQLFLHTARLGHHVGKYHRALEAAIAFGLYLDTDVAYS